MEIAIGLGVFAVIIIYLVVQSRKDNGPADPASGGNKGYDAPKSKE